MARGRVQPTEKIKLWVGSYDPVPFTLADGRTVQITGHHICERPPVTLYKRLHDGGTTYANHAYQWSLPVQAEDGSWTPGEWMEPGAIDRPLAHCQNGLHLTDGLHVDFWSSHGPHLYEVEVEGYVAFDRDKWIAGRVRLLRKVAFTPGKRDAYNRQVRANEQKTREKADRQAENKWLASVKGELDAILATRRKALAKMPAQLKRKLALVNGDAGALERLLVAEREAERMIARAKVVLAETKEGKVTWYGKQAVHAPIPDVLKRQRRETNANRKWLDLMMEAHRLDKPTYYDAIEALYPNYPKGRYDAKAHTAREAIYTQIRARAEEIYTQTFVPLPPFDGTDEEIDMTPIDWTDTTVFEMM